MNTNRLETSIETFTKASEILEKASDEGLKKLSALRKPNNVIHLKDITNKGDKTERTLEASQRIPSLVLLALSVEMQFKLNIFNETGKEPRIHGLKKLFNSLSSKSQLKVQNTIEKNLNLSSSEFDLALDENDQVFINWRYLHESNKTNNAGIAFLKELMHNLKEI
ncbi:MAG: hypothetical protein QM478_07110 [Flavobacteriaceae bacterium]